MLLTLHIYFDLVISDHATMKPDSESISFQMILVS